MQIARSAPPNPDDPEPFLLTFLATGVSVANASDQTRQILVELDRMTGLLCVVFFAVNGAELEPSKLVEAGMVVVERSPGRR